jgi:hypothetical protein
VRELENMVRRMIVLGNEEAVLGDIARREPSRGDEAAGILNLEALGVDLSENGGVDL